MFDAKWLEILKESSGKLLALSVGLGIIIWMMRVEILPPTDSPYVEYGLPIAAVLLGCLGLASILEEFAKFAKDWLSKRAQKNRVKDRLESEQEALREYLPYLTHREALILAYLIINRQKTMTAAIDGDMAATLVSRGVIRLFARPGQQVDGLSVPFHVPDHLWEVLVQESEVIVTPERRSELRGIRRAPWYSGF